MGNLKMVYGVFNPGRSKSVEKDPVPMVPNSNKSDVKFADTPVMSEMVSIRLGSKLILKLALRAHAQNMTLNELIIKILEANIDKEMNNQVILEEKS